MLNETMIDYALLNSFDESLLFEHECIPVSKDDFYTYFYCSNDSIHLDDIFHQVCKVQYASQKEVLFYLSYKNMGLCLYQLARTALSNEHNQNSIQEFMDTLLVFAHEKRCSDIHFETQEKTLLIRFRIDGVLKLFFQFERSLYHMISSVIKLRCNLDITQKRKPLNGRFSLELNDKKIDFRVSTLPTIHGESIVLRILDEQFEYKSLRNLGFDTLHYEQLQEGIKNRHGLILVTGPTGSGKTTTLYSILHQLNCEDKKIITIEDPIEYQMKNVQQVAVNQSMHLGFSDILKHVLRQDPDIIMVGEIRDKESLQIAFQASLTGHLVLSTLHTNDALSTLNRLYDLEAKPYIIAHALKMILSQRLVLKSCACKTGCKRCNFTTFDGRVCIAEVLSINEELSLLINNKASQSKLLESAKKSGFITIKEDALNKLAKHLTTKEELYKVLGNLDELL